MIPTLYLQVVTLCVYKELGCSFSLPVVGRVLTFFVFPYAFVLTMTNNLP